MGESVCGGVFSGVSVYEGRGRALAQLGASDIPVERHKKGRCRLREHQASSPQNHPRKNFTVAPICSVYWLLLKPRLG